MTPVTPLPTATAVPIWNMESNAGVTPNENPEAHDAPGAQEVLDAQCFEGKRTIKDFLESKPPNSKIGKPVNQNHKLPTTPDLKGNNKQNIAANLAMCKFVQETAAYYQEESRRYHEQSRASILKEVAYMLIPPITQIDKLVDGVAMTIC